MTLPPGETVHHCPDYCQRCGDSLSDALPQALGVRKVIDIPDIIPMTKEHRINVEQCKCGCFNKGEFPKEAREPVAYRPQFPRNGLLPERVQCIPYGRLCEALGECFHVSLSQGTVDNRLASMKNDPDGMYDEISSRIEAYLVVDADETGLEVNGHLYWGWATQNDKLTYLIHAPSRAGTAIEKHFPYGLPCSTLVTDRYSLSFVFWWKTTGFAWHICYVIAPICLNLIRRKTGHRA